MNQDRSRRDFIKLTALSGLGFGLANSLPAVAAIVKQEPGTALFVPGTAPDLPFIPRRVASWWNTIEDLQWSQKKIRDKVKQRAEAFAAADIDTALNFGFHIRFDFANYFAQLHEYFAAVKDALHQYNIKFVEHYSCNHVERPRGKDEFNKLHRTQRHHVLLFHDAVAAAYAQYEGHLFNDICEVDIIDGTRGYARQYQMEAFCHNNPDYLDMHKKYLQRLIREVDFDAYMIDDMCDYVGLRACGCKYCRERFKKDYGHEIPPVTDKSFWGDMTKPMLFWGNYDNSVFRDWIKMKDDVVADHVGMVKEVIGKKPMLTCCSSTGPITLNSISLNLERIAGIVDFFMLENVGINVKSVNWLEKDAEALQQKDIAKKRGNAPAIALSYTIYKDGGYLGWSLARFWGVANWASTMNERLEENPADALEMEDVIKPFNNWERKYSDFDFYKGHDFVETRLVYNYYCRINGWRDAGGTEHWDKVKAWSKHLVENNVGYRFVRYEELADAGELLKEKTPLILDGVACLSDAQFNALQKYLSKGGAAWLALPFGTHNEKGVERQEPLSKRLLQRKYKNLEIVETASKSNPLESLTATGKFKPAIRQVAGGKGWAVRLREYDGKIAMHFLNAKMKGNPHPSIKDISGQPVITTIDSQISDNQLEFEIDNKIKLPMSLLSPELGDAKRTATLVKSGQIQKMKVSLDGIKIYAVLQ